MGNKHHNKPNLVNEESQTIVQTSETENPVVIESETVIEEPVTAGLNQIIDEDSDTKDSEEFIGKGYVNYVRVNVRVLPDPESEILTIVPIKTEVNIIESQNDFYYLRLPDDNVGYIRKDLIDIVEE